MWRPKKIGEVVAERVCEFKRRGRKPTSVHLVIGRPLQDPHHTDWWCPVQITGSGIRDFHAIPGVDSMQALILAIEYAASTLQGEARDRGGQILWFGDEERILFARQAVSRAADSALIALLGRLRNVALVLDSGSRESREAREKAVEALWAIAGTVGYAKSRRRSRGKK